MKLAKNIILGLTFLTVSSSSLLANVVLPKLVGNNMVLQRGLPVTLWGWADPGEKITVTILNEISKTKTDKKGRWKIIIPPLSAGGPYDMVLTGKNTITLKNILVGDVWLCSGQSNMEWPVSRSNNAKQEMANANYSKIRLFSIPKEWSTKTKDSGLMKDDITGGEWKEATGENVSEFSAVGYFFGRDLYEHNKVPVGLINNSWGGSAAEAWISPDVLKQMPDFASKVDEIERNPNYLNRKQSDFDEEKKKWGEQVAMNDAGSKGNWEAFDVNDADWKETRLPEIIETMPEFANFGGVMWFRKEFNIDNTDSDLRLSLGAIDDEDQTWVNGTKVGSTNIYNEPRLYTIPANLLKKGKNIIVVRVLDTGGGAGFTGEASQMSLSALGMETVPLSGAWKFKEGVSAPEVEGLPNQSNTPVILYNTLIAPITSYSIKGVIWYQGESNSFKAFQYRTLFQTLITDWRQQWKRDFPFLFVQLANFTKPDVQPKNSAWPELREAQAMALTLPGTGMATAIDIGEADDIHPTNKQEVGRRLALVARKVVYGEILVATGPAYESMTVEGNKIRIKFSSVGGGLKSKDKYGYLEGFAIAGENKKFEWAKAYIEGNSVVVYNDNISSPAAVRYAWSNNPADANLVNKEGLPAFPFRTDTWPGMTEPAK